MKKTMALISIVVLLPSLCSCSGDFQMESTDKSSTAIETEDIEVIESENTNKEEIVEYDFPEIFDFSMIDTDSITDVVIYFGDNQKLEFKDKSLYIDFIEALMGNEYSVNDDEYFGDHIGLDFYDPNNLTPIKLYIYYSEDRYDIFETINVESRNAIGLLYQIKDAKNTFECLYKSEVDHLIIELTKLFEEYDMPYYTDSCSLHDKCYFNAIKYENEDIILSKYKSPEEKEAPNFQDEESLNEFLSEYQHFGLIMYQSSDLETPIDIPEKSENNILKRLVFKDTKGNEFELMYRLTF